jgi:hypothetical protein
VLLVGSAGVDRTAALDAVVDEHSAEDDAWDAEPFAPDPGPFAPDPGPFAPDPGPFAPDPGPFAPDPGQRVLRCSPEPAEAELAFCGLARLLSALSDDELDALATVHHQALTAVLFGGADAGPGGPGSASDGVLATLRLAALRWFQTLAGYGPLLLVVDEVQWLDDASADVLWFVSRRFDRLRIQMAASEQVPPGAPALGRHLCPPHALEIRLDPLGPVDVAHAVRRPR